MVIAADKVWRANQSQVGVLLESAYGTDPGGASLNTVGGLFEDAEAPDPEIDIAAYHAAGAGRDPALITTLRHAYQGRIPSILQDPRMIAWAFGLDTKTGASNPYTHTITKSADETLPSFTAEFGYKAITGGSAAWQRSFTGNKVDTMAISMSPMGELRGDFTIFAQKHATSASLRTLTVATTQPYKFLNGAFTLFGSTFARVLDFRYRLSNGLQPQWYAQSTNGHLLYEMPEGRRTHDVEVTVVAEDTALFDQLVAGTTFAMNAKFTRAASPEDSIDFQFTSTLMRSAPHPIVAEGNIPVRMRFRPTSAQVVCKNNVSTAYT